MKSNLSIRWRLALQFTGLVFLILLVFGSAVYVLVTQKARTDIDTLLTIQYESIANNIRDALANGDAIDFESAQRPGLITVVRDSKGHDVQPLPTQAMPLPTQDGFTTLSDSSHDFRFYRNAVVGYTIVIGEDLRAFEALRQTLVMVLILVFLVMLSLSFGVSALFAERALHPLQKLNRKVREIDPAHVPAATLASAYPDDEIGKLAASFDAFLQRLSLAFERERRFTQDASHELRTPLMVIKSSLELLLLHPESLTSPQKEKLQLMQASLKRMETLTQELLFLSRGAQQSQDQTIDVGAFLKEFLPPFEAMAKAKGLRMDLTTERSFSLRTSKLSLEKVLGNLLKNAVHFTEKGGVSITLAEKMVRIGDTGRGIAADVLPHIFERFYQEDGSRAHTGEGFGLGLAICKEICDQEGWTIAVESALGSGSTFTVVF